MKTKFASVSSLVIALAALVLTADLAVAAGSGSLWHRARGREAAIVSDRRARHIGDILTVVVQESASVQASRSTKTDKKAAVDNAVDQFLFPLSASSFGTHNGALPGTSLSGSSTFQGGGEISNRQSVSARAAVTVIDVLPNGNLVIEGTRYVAYSSEKQYAKLHGIVRPEDIQTGNIVVSSAIADARVEFSSKGAISAAERKGWLSRALDTINPF
jgi:flagellar L-ring protein precursor FlgH